MVAENSVNYALRVLKPVLKGDAAYVDLKLDAEDEYILKMQEALRNRVWHAGCNSCHVNEKSWNAVSYSWSQAHYWWHSLFPIWSDWNIKAVQKPKGVLAGIQLEISLASLVGIAIIVWKEPTIWDRVVGTARSVMSIYMP